MPSKKKKGGARSRKKADAQNSVEKELLVRTCRNFLKAYAQRCQVSRSTPSPRVTRDVRALLEQEKALEKFILEPSLHVPPLAPASADQKGTRFSSKQKTVKPATPQAVAPPIGVPVSANSRATSSGASERGRAPAAVPGSYGAIILVQALVEAWSNVNYEFMRALHVWHLELSDEEMVALALFMESALGSKIACLEIVNGNISPWGLSRLAKSLKSCHLTNLHLDYNRFFLFSNFTSCTVTIQNILTSIPADCLTALCSVLQNDAALKVLSLKSCQLSASCGEALGTLAVLSGLRELNLDNNFLECEGTTELFNLITAYIENPKCPKPKLAKLFMQNNAIDENGKLGPLGPEACMQLVKRWVVTSSELVEVDFDRNYIGDGGGKEIMEAMLQRKEAGLAEIRMTVTSRLNCHIFSTIIELSASVKTKSAKKKKKGRKKAR